MYPADFPHGAPAQEQAFFWLILHQSDSHIQPPHRHAFSDWLQASPDHPTAYKEAGGFWEAVAEAPHVEDALSSIETNVVPFAVTQAPSPLRPTYARHWRGLAAVAAIFLVLVGFTSHLVDFPGSGKITRSEITQPLQTIETAAGETRRIELADGSIIDLSGGSTIQVQTTDARRFVDLAAGQAFFDIAPDRNRPFVVDVGAARVTVVGTQFDLRKGRNTATISVLEGKVNVSANTGLYRNFGVAALGVGQQMRVEDDGKMREAKDVEIDQIASWRAGRLFYDNAPLGELIEDVNRMSGAHMRLDSDALYNLKVTISLQLDQVDQSLADGLAASLGLEVIQNDTEIILQQREEPLKL